MKKKILIGIGAGAFVAICFGIFLLSGAGSTYYYSQIDNTKIEQTGSAGGVINFGGSMDYSYTRVVMTRTETKRTLPLEHRGN